MNKRRRGLRKLMQAVILSIGSKARRQSLRLWLRRVPDDELLIYAETWGLAPWTGPLTGSIQLPGVKFSGVDHLMGRRRHVGVSARLTLGPWVHQPMYSILDVKCLAFVDVRDSSFEIVEIADAG